MAFTALLMIDLYTVQDQWTSCLKNDWRRFSCNL